MLQEFQFTYNDWKAIATAKSDKIFNRQLEILLGANDKKPRKIPKLDYVKHEKLICVVSDTHDDIDSMQHLISFCNRYNIDSMLHAGDLVDTAMLKLLQKKYSGTVFFIMGNHDRNRPPNKYEKYFHFNDDKKIVVASHNGFAKLHPITNKLEYITHPKGMVFDSNLTFRIYHGDDHEYANRIFLNDDCDVYITGHTHERRFQKYDNKIHINPGTFSFNTLPYDDNISFMVLGINNQKVDTIILIKLSML